MAPEEADYVVIGGGSAGCVLANRLSADPRNSVVLLEAGGGVPTGILAKAPSMGMTALGKPETDWCYKTEPDPSANGRQMLWNAGRMLGGGSAINGLVYVRGAREDYDEWAELGCTGWGWDQVLPYFRKSEDFAGPASPSHGKGGPLGVSERTSKHPLAEIFVETCAQYGMRRVEDYCSGDTDGAYLMYVAQRGGTRSSSATAFLDAATLRRSNLGVVTGATVDRVLIENGRAAGVRYIRDGQAATVRCRREVVVSAGSLQSPAVLMRSGIGPAGQLRDFGIDVTRDAPQVGQNLQEHASYCSEFQVDIPTYNTMMRPLPMMRELLKYLLFRKGLMTIAPIEAMAGLRSRPGLAHPDVHLALGAMCIDHATMKPHTLAGVMAFAGVAKPKGRGEVRLRGADPADKPVIDHRMLGHPDDLATMVAGVKEMHRIFATKPLADHVVSRLTPEQLPQSDEEWEQLVRGGCSSSYRPVGTCRMGVDEAAVVDPRLKVRAVAGLRVADVSIMPTIPDAGMTAPAMMIGEKAADMILEDAA